MSPNGVTEPVDVSGDGVFGLLAGLPCDWPDQLRLDGLEERLDHRVIKAISLARHRDQNVMAAKLGLVVDGTILGGFNRSSQHPIAGGADDDGTTEVGALNAAQIMFARTTAGLAA